MTDDRKDAEKPTGIRELPTERKKNGICRRENVKVVVGTTETVTERGEQGCTERLKSGRCKASRETPRPLELPAAITRH